MTERYDAIIVGCGIGGGALATVLARAGKSVLVLEKSTVYRDLVRGEWLAPWGVAEAKRIGLYEALIEAGGHHLSKHIGYGDETDPAVAEANAMDIAALVPGIPGPLCLGHPKHCDTLHATASAAGATVLRGVNDVATSLSVAPGVTYAHADAQHEATAGIIVGADGRGSNVRAAAGIELHKDAPHHLFSGLLVEHADGWPMDTQAIGAEGDVHYLVFPQGNGRARLYLGYPREQTKRLVGENGPRAFLDAFRLKSMPLSETLANATPAGPCHSYPNEDSWTDAPYAEGVVLIGDAAGWNDPIIGQGLSITYRDVRIVSELMLGSDDWSPALFAPYAEERAERMRRLRFSARVQSIRENEFGPEARERRRISGERMAADPMLMLPALATMVGPDSLPASAFEESMLDRLFT